MPCQKRSGRNTVKCQRAMPIVRKTRNAISHTPRSSTSTALASLRTFFAPLLVPLAPLRRLRVGLAARRARLVARTRGTRCRGRIRRLPRDHTLRAAAILGRLGRRHRTVVTLPPRRRGALQLLRRDFFFGRV